jgi:hypothetical protein
LGTQLKGKYKAASTVAFMVDDGAAKDLEDPSLIDLTDIGEF